MKKISMVAVFIVTVVLFSTGLQAYPNLYWEVSSDHTCDTVFYVGEHPDYNVVVTRQRCDVNGVPYSFENEVDVLTFGQYDHYYTYGYCPNFRVLYRAYYVLANGSRVLASTRLYVIRPSSSTPPMVSCRACAEYL